MLPSMTETLFEYFTGFGGQIHQYQSTSGNGVPFYGCNTEIPDFSNTDIHCFPFIGSGNHQFTQFLDKSLGFILNEYVDASSP